MTTILVSLFIAGAMIWSIQRKKLTAIGAFGGGLIAMIIFVGAGFTGLSMLGAFFILGSLATSWKRDEKEKVGVGERFAGRRLGQVFANGGVAGLLGVFSILFPNDKSLFLFMMAASLASATADTLSSELGTVYGNRFFNCITFRREAKGLDGVISVEGVVFGVAGSAVIAAIYCMGQGWSKNFIYILIAGVAGNFFDSLLGATLERKGYLKNDMVNFLNTLFAAFLIWLIK